MNLNTLMRDVHKNAVDHGWWDGKRNDEQIICLIHSEWSEALEEERAGRPLFWLACENGLEANDMCLPTLCHSCQGDEFLHCPHRGKKPEGFAVELIDGCIRILDYIGYLSNGQPVFKPEMDTIEKVISSEIFKMPGDGGLLDVSTLICSLHAKTARALMEDSTLQLIECMMLCFVWIHHAGFDPEEVLLAKHEYNKTRPYKHGKVF